MVINSVVIHLCLHHSSLDANHHLSLIGSGFNLTVFASCSRGRRRDSFRAGCVEAVHVAAVINSPIFAVMKYANRRLGYRCSHGSLPLAEAPSPATELRRLRLLHHTQLRRIAAGRVHLSRRRNVLDGNDLENPAGSKNPEPV